MAKIRPPFPCFILAGGLGTRLRPHTDILPKPLVPVGDQPMIAHVLERVRASGADPVVANAHHLAPLVRAWCEPRGVGVSLEGDLLGTAGGLRKAASLLGPGPVLVHNADVLADVDLAGLMAAHEGRAASATLAVVPGPAGTGNIGTDPDGKIVRIRPVRFAPGEASGGEFTGIYVVAATIREGLPEVGCILTDVIMPRLTSTRDAWSFPAANLRDIGTVAGYLRANADWLAAHGLDELVASSARVDPEIARIRTIIGEGAVVTGHGALTDCVVWPGAAAEAPGEGRVYSTQATWSPSRAIR